MAQMAARMENAEPAAESTYRQLKLDLAVAARRWRRRGEVSPAQIASHLGCSASQFGRLESDESEVSLDLVVRYLLAMGATRRDIALEIVRQS